MAAGDELAASIRAALVGAGTIREVKMFGGIGFMLNGNMVAAASKRGLLARVGKDRQGVALKHKGTRPMVMRGKPLADYVYVDPPALTPRTLQELLGLAVAFVLTLPAKKAATRSQRTKAKRAR
jgi:TfoX/Sxy family transcriptional regulator of competence genes